MASRKQPLLPFEHFLSYSELTGFVTRLAQARPDLVRLASLGDSREGRAIHLLTITNFKTGAAEDKPAYLIHGNIHASELSGTHAALYTASRLVADNGAAALLKRVAFYVVPRLNPDGAEFVVSTSGEIRSRFDRSRREPNTLYQEDFNRDGLILSMRQEHPDGRFTVDPKDRRLLILRTKDSRPPFYRVLPEGLIHQWDGTDHIRIEGRRLDWNRNWSYDWRPEPEQGGAGDFPFSEREMRALADWLFERPNLFAVLGYHTGPNAVLRPPSTGADTDLDAGDVNVMQELAEVGAKHTGFPVIPVVKYHHANSRDINLRGHFHNFGYHHLGLFVFEFELGILQNSAGIKTEDILKTKTPKEREAHARRLMKWWDRQKRRDPIYAKWTRAQHPQLGPVEVGGLLSKHLHGPTLRDLKRIAQGTYRFTLEHARRHPRVVMEEVQAKRVGAGIYQIRARVANRGEFPTFISAKGRGLSRLKGVRVEFLPAPGVRLLSRTGHQDLGHLGGITDGRELEWFVAAESKARTLCELRVTGGAGGNALASVPTPA
jgi:hypothetical protein